MSAIDADVSRRRGVPLDDCIVGTDARNVLAALRARPPLEITPQLRETLLPDDRMLRAPPYWLGSLKLLRLQKKPEQRPQSARELLERLASAAVEPWTTRQAEAWWREHGSRVRTDSLAPTATGRTIQVDLGLRKS